MMQGRSARRALLAAFRSTILRLVDAAVSRYRAGRGDFSTPPTSCRFPFAMIPYETDQTPKKWTPNELKIVAGAVVLLLCIWGLISWKNYSGDETQHVLDRTRTQLAAAKEKIASLESRLAESDKQLADAKDKVMALTSVAARAPQLPISVKQWKDSPSTYAIALQNDGDSEVSVHVTVSNPDRSLPREQAFYVKAHQTVRTPLRIFPHDTAILTADGFATRTAKLD
jgi:hypothetical protein